MSDWKPSLGSWSALRDLVEPFLPGAIGAAVGQAWEPGLSWKQRTLQWIVGLSFAVFVVPGIGHLFGWGDAMVDAVGFVTGTLAFKAVPSLRDAAIMGGAGALHTLPSIFTSWFRKPGSPPPEGDGQ